MQKEYQAMKIVNQMLQFYDFTVTRVETGSTCKGFPDCFVQGNGDDYFIEYKAFNRSIADANWKIEWRPGQQAWAAVYANKHVADMRNDTPLVRQKHSWTFAYLHDGMLCVLMNKHICSNKLVYADAPEAFIFTHDKFRQLNLRDFLRTYTYSLILAPRYSDTLGIYMNRLSCAYAKTVFLLHDMDYPAAPDYYGKHLSKLSKYELTDNMIGQAIYTDNYYMQWLQRIVAKETFDFIKSNS